jgi:hypothetical protein
MKDKLINELTLLDTAMYRHLGLSEKERRFKHEPPRYRNRLYEVYNKLSEEDLQELINIKKGL